MLAFPTATLTKISHPTVFVFTTMTAATPSTSSSNKCNYSKYKTDYNDASIDTTATITAALCVSLEHLIARVTSACAGVLKTATSAAQTLFDVTTAVFFAAVRSDSAAAWDGFKSNDSEDDDAMPMLEDDSDYEHEFALTMLNSPEEEQYDVDNDDYDYASEDDNDDVVPMLEEDHNYKSEFTLSIHPPQTSASYWMCASDSHNGSGWLLDMGSSGATLSAPGSSCIAAVSQRAPLLSQMQIQWRREYGARSSATHKQSTLATAMAATPHTLSSVEVCSATAAPAVEVLMLVLVAITLVELVRSNSTIKDAPVEDDDTNVFLRVELNPTKGTRNVIAMIDLPTSSRDAFSPDLDAQCSGVSASLLGLRHGEQLPMLEDDGILEHEAPMAIQAHSATIAFVFEPKLQRVTHRRFRARQQ